MSDYLPLEEVEFAKDLPDTFQFKFLKKSLTQHVLILFEYAVSGEITTAHFDPEVTKKFHLEQQKDGPKRALAEDAISTYITGYGTAWEKTYVVLPLEMSFQGLSLADPQKPNQRVRSDSPLLSKDNLLIDNPGGNQYLNMPYILTWLFHFALDAGIFKRDQGEFDDLMTLESFVREQRRQEFVWRRFQAAAAPSFVKNADRAAFESSQQNLFLNNENQETKPANEKPAVTGYNLADIKGKITRFFDLSEIRGLCFGLSIDHENLAGSTKQDLVQSLLEYCDRNDMMNDLLSKLKEKRTHVSWE